MPAVGMRRTTRVFGARVLRSGRRLWTLPEPAEKVKQHQYYTRAAANVKEEVIEILDNFEDERKRKEKGRRNNTFCMNQETANMDIDVNLEEKPDIKMDKRWGAVYQRKRKRLDKEIGVDLLSNSVRKYGKQFSRKQGNKRLKESNVNTCLVLAPGVVTSYGSSSSFVIFSCVLNSILRYMRRVSLRLRQLSAFLFSDPIAHVYSLNGIRFLEDCNSITSSGVCKIWGSRCSRPTFVLDFSAVPFVFKYLHSSLLLNSAAPPHALVLYSNGIEAEVGDMTDDEESPDKSGSRIGVSGNSNSKKCSPKRSAAAPKSPSKTLQLRSFGISRSIQKRRSSLRLRRSKKNQSSFERKVNGPLLNRPFTTLTSNHGHISPVGKKKPFTNVQEPKSTLVGLAEDKDASSCSASILVIESDKGYREEGAAVTLESSSSKEWALVIRKDGVRRYNLIAQPVMRPCCCNRITNAIIWTNDDAWKLEFPNRVDWVIFKKLYKECSDRNMEAPAESAIPVPRVVEVSGYGESNSVPFRRPISYISWKDDELTRALEKGGTETYELNSDDEVWLKKFNSESFSEKESDKHVSADVFELIINSFEKASFFGQDYVGAAIDLCMNLERREVLEAVHGYWMNKKRKLKRQALSRIFQCNQPRRTPVLPKIILRKKRSFNPQTSKNARGKKRTFLQAMASEQDSVDEQNIIIKIQEAKAAVDRSEGVAIHKRKRAQVLMEGADLATYKAVMALRIAEAATLVESPKAADFFPLLNK